MSEGVRDERERERERVREKESERVERDGLDILGFF